MFKFLSDLFGAIGRLAGAVNGLAATVERVDEAVKERLLLEERAPAPVAKLEGPPAPRPEEIDHGKNGWVPPTPNPLPPPVEERPTKRPRGKAEGVS